MLVLRPLRGALAETGKRTGTHYQVTWQDFPSGPPLTAQMIAGKVDIGSMGDYSVLVNGSKTSQYPDARSELVAITGYNLRGSLNQIVVPTGSAARTLSDLRSQVISTSVGSAAHGMLVNALRRNGLTPADVKVLNQDPSVGASALEGKQVAALAQFVPWPQLMIFRKQAHLLYDGGSNGVPTFHAVVARQAFSTAHPEVLQAFWSPCGTPRTISTTTHWKRPRRSGPSPAWSPRSSISTTDRTAWSAST
ncbi:MAG: ABC transporter substrate-binding protein [Pseudonocardiaceae bacterium]